MSAATSTARKSNRSASAAATKSTATTPDLLATRAAMFAFLGKLAADEGERDDMADGQHSEVTLSIVAEVDGKRCHHAFAGTVDVGHASTRASSVGPNQDELLALVLAKLNHQTRDKLCRDLADEFAAAGGKLPAVDKSIVDQAAKLKSDLRQKVDQSVRGSVRVKYAAAQQPSLAVVGDE